MENDILKKLDDKINTLEKNNIQPSALDKEISRLSKGNIEVLVKLKNFTVKISKVTNEIQIIELLEKLAKYNDIFDEFTNYLLMGKIVKNEKSICEQGYTAYDILEKEPCLLPHNAYLWLVSLRENDEATLKNLKNGIPVDNALKLSHNINSIREYLQSQISNNTVVNKLANKYYKYPDIANEFEYYIRTSRFVEDNPITECGYTAKRLYSEHKDKLNISGVFSMLITLREKPEKGLKYIADNFPQK